MATKLYRIADWEENFEVAQSKRIQKALPWVALPTKHDGKSYRRVMRMPDGPAIYCAWVLIVQVAAKCDRRGVLADADGPLSSEDLSIKTDCPPELFERAFEVLSDPKIGWLLSSEWGATRSTLNGSSTTLNQPSTMIRTRTNEQTDITNEQTDMVDSIDRAADFDSVDLEDAFGSNPVSKRLSESVRTASKADRDFLAKIGILVTSKRLPESWAFDSEAAVIAKGSAAKIPVAYFRSCLAEHCSKGAVDLAGLLGESPSNPATGPPSKVRSKPFEFPEPRTTCEP